VVILQVALSTKEYYLPKAQQHHIVLCLKKIIHGHLLPGGAVLVSLPPVGYNVTFLNLMNTHPQEDDFRMSHSFLRNVWKVVYEVLILTGRIKHLYPCLM